MEDCDYVVFSGCHKGLETAAKSITLCRIGSFTEFSIARVAYNILGSLRVTAITSSEH